MRKNIFRASLFSFFLLLFGIRATANIYNVTTTSDFPISGAGISVNNANGVITGGTGNGFVTLRSAIAAANNTAGSNTINLGAGTFNLTISGAGEGTAGNINIGDLDVLVSGITIQGAGMNSTIINQTTGIERVFDVNVPFVLGAAFNFTIDGVTVSGGRSNAANGFTEGGGIFCGNNNANGTTTVTNCKFLNNQSAGAGLGGGAISNDGGNLIVTGCIFGGTNPTDFNQAGTSGGAIYWQATGLPQTFTCTNSTFTNNVALSASAGGGAIDVAAINLGTGTVSVTGCTFTGNHANSAGGGGVMNESVNVTITKCTFLNNTAGRGGAVRNGGGTGTTVNFSRLLGNTASTAGNVFDGGVALNGDNNWWGVNGGPPAGSLAGLATATNWLQLKSSASPAIICGAGSPTSTTVTSGFLSNSAGNVISNTNLGALIGQPISFVNPVLGTLSAAQSSIQASGTATVLFTATGTAGAGSVNAVVDNVPNNDATAKASITINKPTVTNPGVTTGTVGTAFSQTFTQAGGALPVTFSTASTLPTGLSLSTAGVLSGTPTQSGSFGIVVTVTDNNGCTGTGATYTLVISCPAITVTNPGTTTGTVGSAFSQNFGASGGTSPYTFTTVSTLPTGLTLSTAGVLSGTPTQSGSFPIVVKATDANACFGNGATYTLVISCQTITVTNPAVTTGVNGTPFSQTFTQTGAIGGATFTLNTGVLPTGLTLSAAGVLSGTPTQTGPFPITVKVTDGNSCTGTGATYNLVIGAPVLNASLRDALLVDNNGNLIANPNDQLRYTTTIRNPTATDATGVNLNLAAPTNTTENPNSRSTSALARDDAFTAIANNVFNSGNVITNDFGLNAGVPTVTVVSFGTTASLGTTTPAGSVGTTNAGGVLTVNTNGTFSYNPPPAFTGTDQFMYIATTGIAGLPNNDAVVTITVIPDITFSTTPVNPTCNGASTGSITFSGVSGGSGPVYTYSITGAGGTYFASPSFTGLPAGTYNPAVKDGTGNIKTAAAITLTNPPLITFTHTDVNNTCAGAAAGSITFSASGGTGLLSYSITGAGGSYFATPSFIGLTGSPGGTVYNLAVKDLNGCIVTGTATLTDPPAITFTFTKTDITCFGAANGSIVFNTTTGGTGPYTYSITGTGGTFFASNSFSPLTASTYTLVVKDATGCNSATQSTTVSEPVAIVVSGTIPNLTYNVAMATATFTKTGGVGSPANPWSVSAGSLPTGVTLNTATGAVTGTPLQTGSFNVTIKYTDATGCFGTKAVSFTVAPNLANNTFNVVGNTQLVADGHSAPSTPFTTDATNIRTNDQADVSIVITAGTFATVNGGSITIDAAGKFTYTPPVGSTAADSYVYTGTANGVSATATINFTIANMVWYVNKDYAGANGASDGRSHRPYTDVASAETPSLINQIIYVHTGTGNTTGNALLKSGQTLRGAGSALNVGALSIAAGTKPTLTGMITLANSVVVDGFDMSTGATTAITSTGATGVTVSVGNIITSGAVNAVTLTNTTGSVIIAGGTQTNSTGATFNISGGTVSLTYSGGITQTANAAMVNVSGGHTTGTITFNTGALSATNGTGFQFDNADGTYNFNGTSTLNGGDAGIDLANGCGGTFSFPAGISITNPTNEVIKIINSAANFTYGGGFTKNNNNISGITISGNTGGTIAINGSGTKTLSTGTGNAVNLTTNTGTTINFSNNNLQLTTSTGIGFNTTGGGTISVTGTGNIISSGTGTALNVVSTTIGASNLNFQSISSTGATNGIILNNTGTSGGLTVTGDAGSSNNSSGGTITNSVDGISLTSTRDVSLDQMNIQTSSGSGINGTTVTNFTLTNSTINNSGNAGFESNISFNNNPTTANNIAGTLTITGCTLTNAYYSGLDIQAGDGTITNAIISNNTITNTNQGSGINFNGTGTATTILKVNKATVTQNNISNVGDDGIQFNFGSNAGGPGAVCGIFNDPANLISITSNSILLNPVGAQAITVSVVGLNPAQRSTSNFDISCNGKNTGGCTSPTGTALGSSSQGTVILIGNNAYTDMSGIVNNNAIVATQTPNLGGGNGIAGGNGVGGAGNAWAPNLKLSVTNNSVSGTDGNGILLVGRGTSGFANMKITGNTVGTPVNAGGTARECIRIDAGNAASADDGICLTLSGNICALGSNGAAGLGIRKQGTIQTTNDFGLTGLAPSPATGAQAAAYVVTQNPAGNGCDNISGSNFQSCGTAPPIAPPPVVQKAEVTPKKKNDK